MSGKPACSAEVAIYKIRQQKGNFAARENKQFDVEGTLSVIFKAAQNPSEFGVEATSGHRTFISA